MSGLPPLSPDWVEQDQGDEFDDIVPTRGYQMQPVVGLGGSAGGIPALQRFFEAMPPDSGMAFVVVLHLAPEHTSIMDEIIARCTAMPVVQAEDHQKVEANTVYVIPPGKFLSAANGRLQLSPIEPERGRRVSVDLFFRTLADTHGPTAAAIILSGADGDGALGIKRIKERGGLTIAQAPEEAEHSSMPRSAIDTGMVDWILPVAEMPARLMEYRAQAGRLQLPREDGPNPAAAAPIATDADETALRGTLAHLRSRTGRDFSCYKRATVVRRISRRMQVNGVASISEYLAFLRMHPGEAGALQQDLLISVTNFFRDREAFDALERELPAILAGKGPGEAVRVWTAGCATGEEAYSIAMLLIEQADRMAAPPLIQVFATDLAEEVIAAAREGFYPFTIQADVSEERLRRFFTREHRGFRIRRELRECLLFAVHDLLKDAPFSRMDLFTCRNLLIYLTSDAQKRALEIAHFAVRTSGLLFVGSSESTDEEGGRWAAVDKKHRLYRRGGSERRVAPVPIGPSTLTRAIEAQERARGGPHILGAAFARQSAAAVQRTVDEQEGRKVSWEELHFKMIERFAPPSLIVTRDYDIVHVSENAGRFLHFQSGEPTVNLLKVVHPMLRVELRAALFRAAQTNVPVEAFRIPVEIDKETVMVDIRVAPAQEIAPDYLLVVFAVRETSESVVVQARQEDEPAVRHLERENEQLKQRLRDTVEQYEASLEEQKASSEELQAMNEELRSSAEELETSREELQSVNEELTTVNQELKSKVDALAHANADLANLMSANGVATVFLDRSLAITRYTPTAVTLFRLIPTDVGRPLSDLTNRLNYPNLQKDAEQVLETLVPLRREVTDENSWYLAQLLPYRTEEDRIGGVVLTFVDITEARQAEQARARLAAEVAHQARIFNTVLSSIADFAYTFDREGRFIFANRPLLELFGRTLEETVGRNFLEVGYTPELAAKLQAQVEHVFTTGKSVVDETPFTSPAGIVGYYEYIFRPVLDGEGRVETVAGSTRDVTDRKRSEAALRASEERLRTLADAVPQVIWANDGNGVADYFNRRWYEFTGLSEEESIGAGWEAVVHPEDAAGSKERWERAQEAGEVFDCEYRLRGADGAYRWFIGRNVPTRDASGRVTGWFGTATDIQELKEATAALRASEEQFRRALEDSPIPVMMHAEDGQVLQLSKAWTELTGYQPRDLPNHQVWLERAFGARAAVMREELRGVFRGARGRADAEMEVLTKSGETRRWSFSASAPGSLRDGRRFIVTMAVDVTERARAEEALRESQERLRLVVENAREYAIFSLNLERRITSWNSGARGILQYSEEEATGQSGDLVFTPEDREQGAPEREAETAIREGRAADERWHVRKDGSRFWGSGVLMAMQDGEGQPIGLVKIFRDQTEELRAKEALEKSREELWEALQETDRARAEAEAAGKAKDHFLAVLSHELRTPLTPVLMAAQTLARRKDLPDAVREGLMMIRRNVQLESSFIDELLDITKIERGKMELVSAPMDMHEAIRHAVEVSGPDLQAKGQSLTVSLEAREFRLDGDFPRLQQVVWNLLKNASKFTPEGGRISLKTRNAAEALLIEVADSGIGIGKEALARIFDPFTQADEAITREYGGLGLGLAIARASVLAHGGEIRVESEGMGRGSTFTVSLPLPRPLPDAGEPR